MRGHAAVKLWKLAGRSVHRVGDLSVGWRAGYGVLSIAVMVLTQKFLRGIMSDKYGGGLTHAKTPVAYR